VNQCHFVNSSTEWGRRGGDEDLAVFCVAAILKCNRRQLLQLEGTDEAIKVHFFCFFLAVLYGTVLSCVVC